MRSWPAAEVQEPPPAERQGMWTPTIIQGIPAARAVSIAFTSQA